MDRDNLFIQHILEAITEIDSYISGVSFDEFLKDKKLQAAVIYRIQIVGEAAKNLSAEFVISRPHIPWKDIAGMRDILIHEYAGVHVERVWRTAKDDLPPLKKTIIELMGQNVK